MSLSGPKSAQATTSVSDRLGSTLFLAALAHGVVILGVTFAGDSPPDGETLPSLRVTLLNDNRETEREPEDSEFLAERSRRGAGPREEGLRVTTTLSSDDPEMRFGEPLATDLRDAAPDAQTEQAEQLLARSRADAATHAPPELIGNAASTPTQAAAQILPADRRTLAAEIDVEARVAHSADDDGAASPATRESALAAYLVDWRRRVERIGTGNFPRRLLAQGRELGKPTLEVTLAADGQLEQVVVRRSSGDAQLDQAALAILRRAAPFEPLPASIRAEYDVLRFAYDWEFSPSREPAPEGLPLPQ